MKGVVRITGLGRLADRVADRVARGVGEGELTEIEKAVVQAARRVEAAVARGGYAAEQLTAATREQRGWFAWLARDGGVRAYAAAVERARGALEAAARAEGRAVPVHVEFRPSRHIYRMRTRAGRARVTLPTPMVRFDDAGFAELAALVFGVAGARGAKRRVVERMCAAGYAELRDELEALGGVVDGARGRFHDLGESFDRVNARYFGGEMARPRLTWSAGLTRRKFGHFDHVRDWVMVSSTLDQAGVPAWVVDYLMYHELLHKKHGIRWVNGRGYSHTRAFYADERRFEGMAEAEGWLKKLARGRVE